MIQPLVVRMSYGELQAWAQQGVHLLSTASRVEPPIQPSLETGGNFRDRSVLVELPEKYATPLLTGKPVYALVDEVICVSLEDDYHTREADARLAHLPDFNITWLPFSYRADWIQVQDDEMVVDTRMIREVVGSHLVLTTASSTANDADGAAVDTGGPSMITTDKSSTLIDTQGGTSVDLVGTAPAHLTDDRAAGELNADRGGVSVMIIEGAASPVQGGVGHEYLPKPKSSPRPPKRSANTAANRARKGQESTGSLDPQNVERRAKKTVSTNAQQPVLMDIVDRAAVSLQASGDGGFPEEREVTA